MALTRAAIEEIKLYYANHPAESYASIGEIFGLDKSTIWRIVNKGNPVNPDAPFNKTRTGTHEATENNALSQRSPKVAYRQPPRTEALIAGAKNEGKEIMKKLDELLQGQDARLDEILMAEELLLEEVKSQDMTPLEGYKLAMQMNKNYNSAILAMKDTLQQMALLSRNINIFVDNRRILNVTYEQLPPMARQRMDEAVTERLIGDMWPLMCQECKARFIELTKVQPMEPGEQ